MNRYNVIFVILFFFVFSALLAHENHNKEKQVSKPDTLTIVEGDTIAINGIATAQFLKSKRSIEADSEQSEMEEEVKEVTFEAAFEHPHNKLIHFPIALTAIALLLLIIGYKENKYFSAIKIIVPFAAIVTILTVLTGQAQEEPFEGTAIYALVETHELLGFGVLISLILWSISLYVERFKKLIYLFAVLTFILVSLTGLYGGVIAH
ncbi:MAG: hypothetical protein L3J41_01235 [Melioribacteraceae bacterium]|nr:hypothetical protein [Melioribacteraceae bacterium]